jgi:hypothetical protein
MEEAFRKSLVETGLFALLLVTAKSVDTSGGPKIPGDKIQRALLVLFVANFVLKLIDDDYDKVFLSGTIFFATTLMLNGLLPVQKRV